MSSQSHYHFDTDINSKFVSLSDTDTVANLTDDPDLLSNNSIEKPDKASVNHAKIMILSDDMLNSEMIQQFLIECGYSNVIMLNEMNDAFGAILYEHPDAILYETNGLTDSTFKWLERISENIKTSLIPLVILTADKDESAKLKALELGVVDVIYKPASEAELALRLRNILSVKTYHDQIANYDSLTNLPNRQTFMSRLDWILKYNTRYKTTGAVVQLGLNDTQKLNDAYGIGIFDSLIKQVSTRIQSTIRESDIVAQLEQTEMETTISRITVDEFSILLPILNRVDDAAIVSKRLRERIAQPYQVDGNEIYITCKTGIAITPNDGEKHETIMKAANQALHQARANVNVDSLFYSENLNKTITHRVNVLNNLVKAIEENQLEVYYQPKISLKTRRLIGGEALLRWRHPTLGFINPDEFIPLAEESGHIQKLGAWVIETVIGQIKKWEENGITVPRIAINISGDQLNQHGFVKEIKSSLDQANVDGSHLTIELTETVMMGTSETIVENINTLKGLGIKISIDDFGTGYSSLVQLKELPIDELKIDRTFTWDIGGENNTEAIILAMIAMAKSLNLNVVAEGVETEDQLLFLKKHLCDEYQGYLFSPAITAKDFGALIA